MESNNADQVQQPPVLLRAKILVVGEPTTGKSAIVQMLHSDGTHYPKNYIMTVGADFCVKPIHLLDMNATVELFLYDCAGQPFYHDLVAQYCKDVSMVVVVYDISREETLEKARDWVEFVQKAGNDKIKGVLIGNKCDLRDNHCIHPDAAKAVASKLGLEHFTTSAKSNDLDGPFQYLARSYLSSFRNAINGYTSGQEVISSYLTSSNASQPTHEEK